MVNKDSSVNILKWLCYIPGPKDTIWAGGYYKLILDFTHGYPVRPPKCIFHPVPPHPNIYPSGTVCLSILNEEEDWRPHFSIRQILLGIQKLLADKPNINSPAQQIALSDYKNNLKLYEQKAKTFALKSTMAQNAPETKKELSTSKPGSQTSKKSAK